MNFCVNNKQLRVEDVKIGGIGNASLFLIGDAEVITSSSIFDTPENSLIYKSQIPLFDAQSDFEEARKFFHDE